MISDGNRCIVVGMAMSGLSESLGLKEENTELNIPDFVEVTADVTDFELKLPPPLQHRICYPK